MSATHEIGKLIMFTVVFTYVIGGIIIAPIPNIAKVLIILSLVYFVYSFISNGNNSV